MTKFYLVVFRVIAPERGGRFRETGGGVAFLPEPRPDNWHSLIAALVKSHFEHPLGPCVEVGFATADEAMLERHCQRHGQIYWQGGDG